jgi:hypothetical protein
MQMGVSISWSWRYGCNAMRRKWIDCEWKRMTD